MALDETPATKRGNEMLRIKMLEIPKFESEDEERDFLAEHDSTDFLEGAKQVTLEYEEKRATSKEIYKEMVERWKVARQLYELYPRVLEAMRQGRYMNDYRRRIEEIAHLYGERGLNK